MSAVWLCAVLLAGAPEALKEASDRFSHGDAAGAAQAYETALSQGAVNEDVYFNLGTTALRAGDLGRAVWALSMARRLTPTHPDVLFNLDLAQKANPDTLVGLQEPALVAALLWVPRAPVQGVAYVLWLSFCVFLFLRGVTGPRRILERALVRLGLVAVLVGAFALTVELTAGAPLGVIMPKEVTVRSTPESNGPEAFKIHAGLGVRPMEVSASGMLRIRLANGLEGYVEDAAVRRVGR